MPQSKPAELAQPVVPRGGGQAKRIAKRTDCSPVLHWVGKGKTETEIAKLLNISVQAVQLCDEQIGNKR